VRDPWYYRAFPGVPFLLTLSIGLWRRRRRARLRERWVLAEGRIVDEVWTSSSEPSAGPVVAFTTEEGEEVRALPRSWSYFGYSRIGKAGTVLHDPARPERFEAWFGRYDWTGIHWFGAAGLCFVLTWLIW